MTEATREPKLRFYQKGTFTLGNRLAPAAGPAFEPAAGGSDAIPAGHRDCPGCGVALAARHVAAVLRQAGFAGQVRLLDPSGQDAPAVIARNDDVLCLSYDPEGAGAEPGNLFGQGKGVEFARRHAIAYVATATIADLRDLERKLAKALTLRGTRYIHIHAPCPAVWGTPPRETIYIARLAAEGGFFPVFEAENGVVTASRKIRHRRPVVDYLRPRLVQLRGEDAAKLQAMADRNIIEFDLLPRKDDV